MRESAAPLPRESTAPLWMYGALVCLLSWPVWFFSGVLPRGGAGPYDIDWWIAQVGVFGPSLAALALSALSGPALRANALRLLPLLVGPLAVPGSLVARAAPASPAGMPPGAALATGAVALVVVLYFLPLGRRVLTPGSGEPQQRPGVLPVVLSLTLLPGLFLAAWAVANVRGGDWEIAAFRGGWLDALRVLALLFAHNLLLGGSLGEELGWRGFLLPGLLRRTTPLGASLLIGVAWGLWHLPIDLYAGFGLEGLGAVAARVLYAIPMSIVFTWFWLRSRGSLLVVLLLHTSVNVLGDLGLSRYQTTALLFFVLLAATATLLTLASPVLRPALIERDHDATGPIAGMGE